MFHYVPFIKLGNVPQTQIASNEHSWGIKIRRIFFNFNKLAYDESGEESFDTKNFKPVASIFCFF